MELLTLDLYILLFPPLDRKYVTWAIWLRIMTTCQYKRTACMALHKSLGFTVTGFDYFCS